MPNRIIKESICTSENLSQISCGAERLFYRLMVQADDFGLMFANSKIVRSKCFPLISDDIKCKQVESWLVELQKANILFFYKVDEIIYLKFTKWEKHQQQRAVKPKYPLPVCITGNVISCDINGNQVKSSDIGCLQLLPIIENDSSNRDTIIDKRESKYSVLFETFWKAYPRKADKVKAYQTWNSKLKAGVLAEDIIKGAEAYAIKTVGTEEKFIKLPTTFLNAGSYENDPLTAEERAIQDWLEKGKAKDRGELNG